MRTLGTFIKETVKQLVVELIFDTYPRRANYDRLFVAVAGTAPQRGM